MSHNKSADIRLSMREGDNMNVLDILKYGHLTLLGSVKGLSEAESQVEGVCGWWSVKDIMAHMTSYEHLLAEVLDTFLGAESGPNMTEMAQQGGEWNDLQVERRKDINMAEVLAEYNQAHDRVMDLAARVPAGEVPGKWHHPLVRAGLLSGRLYRLYQLRPQAGAQRSGDGVSRSNVIVIYEAQK